MNYNVSIFQNKNQLHYSWKLSNISEYGDAVWMNDSKIAGNLWRFLARYGETKRYSKLPAQNLDAANVEVVRSTLTLRQKMNCLMPSAKISDHIFSRSCRRLSTNRSHTHYLISGVLWHLREQRESGLSYRRASVCSCATSNNTWSSLTTLPTLTATFKTFATEGIIMWRVLPGTVKWWSNEGMTIAQMKWSPIMELIR